ncbi:uncharacterized protein LOC114531153 [Dendronephthya gigantea]|uniref:uncharacterized protein LOC114531153 n=1 Tax=Dendronephthya gigantea TaxID=151771 RepID=UPI00106A3EC8|nr:uncharacterized protein LOC114531153 [Dendronephthya gigantea]
MTQNEITFNDEIWKDIKRRSEKNQKKFLKWHLQAREPINKFSDIKIGDHLVKKAPSPFTKNALYYHHFLCTGRDSEGKPIITHYYNTPANAIKQIFTTLSFGSGSAKGQIASVQEYSLPHEDFIKSECELQEKGGEVERVVWPDELKRYPVEEVIKRARKRKDETLYDLINNNCESFVMWCICDCNISLQATSFISALVEFVSGITSTFFKGLQQVLQKIIKFCLVNTTFWKTNSLTEAWRQAFSKENDPIFGIVLSVLAESINAAKSIYDAREKWENGVLITSRAEYIKAVIEAVVLALIRSGFSIGGTLIGPLIPIPFVGSYFGELIGTFAGHLVGKGFSKIISETIASCICMNDSEDKTNRDNELTSSDAFHDLHEWTAHACVFRLGEKNRDQGNLINSPS